MKRSSVGQLLEIVYGFNDTSALITRKYTISALIIFLRNPIWSVFYYLVEPKKRCQNDIDWLIDMYLREAVGLKEYRRVACAINYLYVFWGCFSLNILQIEIIDKKMIETLKYSFACFVVSHVSGMPCLHVSETWAQRLSGMHHQQRN